MVVLRNEGCPYCGNTTNQQLIGTGTYACPYCDIEYKRYAGGGVSLAYGASYRYKKSSSPKKNQKKKKKSKPKPPEYYLLVPTATDGIMKMLPTKPPSFLLEYATQVGPFKTKDDIKKYLDDNNVPVHKRPYDFRQKLDWSY